MAKKKSDRKNSGRKGKSTPKRKKSRKSASGKKAVSKRNPKKQKKSRMNAGLSNYLRIKKYLWKKHGKEFGSFQEKRFLSAVSWVYTNCKMLGSKCKNSDIEFYYEDWKQSQESLKTLRPEIPFRLTAAPSDSANFEERNNFFVIDTQVFQNALVVFPKYLWITSPMLVSKKYSDFLPENYDYAKTFQEWVNWCNFQHSQSSFPDKYEPFFRMTEPYWSEEKGRWETELYSCDWDGNRWDYGFQPTGDIGDDGKVVPAPEVPKAPTVDGAAPTIPPSTIEDAKRKAEQQKLEIDKLKLELVSKQQEITKGSIEVLAKEQTRIMNDIKEMKAVGAPKEVMDALFKEYAETSKKLTELKSKLG